MQFIILLLHVFICVSLIALVLLQHGKGADIGAAFGAGASNTVFGSTGASSFLMKLTGTLAAIFFCTSLYLGYIDAHLRNVDQFKLPIGSKSFVIPGEANPAAPITAPKTDGVQSPAPIKTQP